MKNTLKLITLFVCLFTSFNSYSQYYHWEWGRCMKNRPQAHTIPLGPGAEANVVATDHFGHVYACAVSADSFAYFGTHSYVNPDTSCATGVAYLVKYDTLGNAIWVKGFGNKNEVVINCVVTDRVGNIYMAGYFNNLPIIFGSDTLRPVGYEANAFIVKLDSNGNSVWARQIDSLGQNFSISIALDDNDNVFFTSSMGKSKLILGPDTLIRHHGAYFGGADVLLVKYDPNGNVLWARNAGGFDSSGSTDLSNAVATDNAGNVYITGTLHADTAYFDTLKLPNPYTHFLFSYMFVAKYSASGVLRWAKSPYGFSTYDTSTTSSYWRTWGDASNAIAIDNFANVYLSGGFAVNKLSFGGDTIVNNREGFLDVFLARLDSNGAPAWLKRFGSNGDEFTYAMSMDSSYNNIWITGSMNSFSIFGADTIIEPYPYAPDPVFIAKCSVNGQLEYVTSLRSGGDDADGIATDDHGNVYICGDYLCAINDFVFGNDTLDHFASGEENFYLAKLAGPWYKYDSSGGGDTTTGIRQILYNNIGNVSVLPNPSNGQFTISYDGMLSSPAVVCLYNLNGQLLNTYTMAINKLTVSAGDLPTGIYFLKVIIDGKVTVKKVEIL